MATLLSTLHRFTTENALASTHPFSSKQPTNELNDLIEATSQLSHSLEVHLNSTPLSNPKLNSLFRQHAAISHTLHQSDQKTVQTISSLLTRPPTTAYGLDIPLSRTLLIHWAIARLEACGTRAGMEMFRDDTPGGARTTLVFGGKVLVMDLDLAISPTTIDAANIKTTYAVSNQDSTSNGPPALDALLLRTVRVFLESIQAENSTRDPIHAERIEKQVESHLKYLMMLDALAAKKGPDGGPQWFLGTELIAELAHSAVKTEAASVASALVVPCAPLDVFLLRAQALALPYLIAPTLSFLVHLTPLAYLSLLRSLPTPSNGPLDIPEDHLRTFLTTQPPPLGATVATLTLTSAPPPPSITHNQEHAFPPGAWVLDFTSGVVLSQRRMRAIERVVRDAKDMNEDAELGTMFEPRMGSGSSWVDLLLDPNHASKLSPGRYTTIHHSPTGLHPPLRLRLASPRDEPGFVLERVGVRTLREAWAVLEVVREQCWLNGLLSACDWVPEDGALSVGPDDSTDATDAELEAVLGGRHPAHTLPVNVYLPGPGTALRMTIPAQTGLVEIGVVHDTSAPRGLRVQLGIGVGADEEVLEEVVRRGGVWGVPGRVWAWGVTK